MYKIQSLKTPALRLFLVFWLERRSGGTNSPATQLSVRLEEPDSIYNINQDKKHETIKVYVLNSFIASIIPYRYEIFLTDSPKASAKSARGPDNKKSILQRRQLSLQARKSKRTRDIVVVKQPTDEALDEHIQRLQVLPLSIYLSF